MIAFDSGAVVALFKAEDGADVVRQLLIDHKGECFIHAVNLVEIHYNFRRECDAAYADDILEQINDMGIEIRNDLDIDFLRDTSFLKVNHKMSLGDTFGIALARRLNCEFVSTDHHELDAVAASGVCKLLFIR